MGQWGDRSLRDQSSQSHSGSGGQGASALDAKATSSPSSKSIALRMGLASCYEAARHSDVVVAIPGFGELFECSLECRK